jgi:hypothetical protein
VLNHGEASAGDKYQLVASSDVAVVKDSSVINFQVPSSFLLPSSISLS